MGLLLLPKERSALSDPQAQPVADPMPCRHGWVHPSGSWGDAEHQVGVPGKVVMGPFSELRGLKNPVWGLLGPCEFGRVVCLQPWEMPHVRLCADVADNTSLDVWDISPEQTPRKEKLVKSQLLPGRDGRVTKSISTALPRVTRPAAQPPAVALPARVFSVWLLAWLPRTCLPSSKPHVIFLGVGGSPVQSQTAPATGT